VKAFLNHPSCLTALLLSFSSPASAEGVAAQPIDDGSPALKQVVTLINANLYGRALITAEDETKNHPERASAWYSLGLVYYNDKCFDDAIVAFNKANSINPNIGQSWFTLGVCFSNLGKHDQAIEPFTKTIDLMPYSPAPWFNLLTCFASVDPIGEEGKMMSLAEQHPKSPYGWWLLGGIQCDRGEGLAAQTALLKAVELKPNEAPILNALGLAYLKAQQMDQAIQAFARSIQLHPGYDEALNNLGYTYFLEGKIPKAIEAFQQALRSNSLHEKALYNLSQAYIKRGQWDLAWQTSDTLERVNPKGAAILRQSLPPRKPAVSGGPSLPASGSWLAP
jgi:tetratricopeptide (TPR) repeat protein